MAHYQRTATTITSAGNRNPANAERAGDHGRDRAACFTIGGEICMNKDRKGYFFSTTGAQPFHKKNGADNFGYGLGMGFKAEISNPAEPSELGGPLTTGKGT
jgi:hypothetical protein